MRLYVYGSGNGTSHTHFSCPLINSTLFTHMPPRDTGVGGGGDKDSLVVALLEPCCTVVLFFSVK